MLDDKSMMALDQDAESQALKEILKMLGSRLGGKLGKGDGMKVEIESSEPMMGEEMGEEDLSKEDLSSAMQGDSKEDLLAALLGGLKKEDEEPKLF